MLWGDDSSSAENTRHGLSYIPAPKPKLPGDFFNGSCYLKSDLN